MSGFWTFVFGMIVGANVGVVAFSIFVAARRRDDDDRLVSYHVELARLARLRERERGA